jgi:hypothetical protein
MTQPVSGDRWPWYSTRQPTQEVDCTRALEEVLRFKLEVRPTVQDITEHCGLVVHLIPRAKQERDDLAVMLDLTKRVEQVATLFQLGSITVLEFRPFVDVVAKPSSKLM